MSRMIVLLSVVIALFAVAAGGSWYLQSQQAKDPEETRTAGEKSSKGGNSASGAKSQANSDAVLKGPVIRPSAAPPEAERLTQLGAALQQQQEAIKAREQQIGVREKQMDIVHDEIKREQKKLEVTRREVQAELQMLESKLAELEKRATDGDRDRKAADVQKKELERTILEVDAQEWKNLKDQVKKLESMDPESAALVVVQMVDQGKLDTVVKMLSQMRDRQAAAIFAEVAKQDAKLPGQLFERMLTLKTPTIVAPR